MLQSKRRGLNKDTDSHLPVWPVLHNVVGSECVYIHFGNPKLVLPVFAQDNQSVDRIC